MAGRSNSAKRKRWTEEKLEKSGVLKPLTQSQSEYIEAIRNHDTVISIGSAGTGKTFIAASIAAEMMIRKDINKIILVRPLVSVGKFSGALPGTIEEKLEPWFAEIFKILERKMGKGAVEIARKNKDIEMCPFETMQGRSFDDAFIILDEAQNCTPFEMKMFLTRIGENCKAIIDGDIKQCSLKSDSGLRTVLRMIEDYKLPVPVIEFTLDDIVRSKQCLIWQAAFEANENNQKQLEPKILELLKSSPKISSDID